MLDYREKENRTPAKPDPWTARRGSKQSRVRFAGERAILEKTAAAHRL